MDALYHSGEKLTNERINEIYNQYLTARQYVDKALNDLDTFANNFKEVALLDKEKREIVTKSNDYDSMESSSQKLGYLESKAMEAFNICDKALIEMCAHLGVEDVDTSSDSNEGLFV